MSKGLLRLGYLSKALMYLVEGFLSHLRSTIRSGTKRKQARQGNIINLNPSTPDASNWRVKTYEKI